MDNSFGFDSDREELLVVHHCYKTFKFKNQHTNVLVFDMHPLVRVYANIVLNECDYLQKQLCFVGTRTVTALQATVEHK